MTGDRADAAGAATCRSSPYRADRARAAGGRRAAGAASRTGTRRVAQAARSSSRCPTRSARSSHWLVTRERLDGDRARRPRRAADACRSSRATSASCSAAFSISASDVTRPYVEALEARGMPHLLVGGKSFHDREEVETLRAALAAIEWPDDELSVFATLRGAAVRDRRRGAARVPRIAHSALPSVPACAEDAAAGRSQPVGEALRLLRELHAGRNHRPVADTIAAAARARRAPTSASSCGRRASRRSPTCCTSPSSRASTRRTAACRSAASSSELRDEAEAAQAAEAPILEEGSDGVRLMTVHKAKGLEFPVVILADIDREAARGSAVALRRRARGRAVRAQPRRLDAARAAASTRPTKLARDRGRRRAPRLRRRDARARSAGRAGRRRRAVRGGWVEPLNAAIYPARAIDPAGRADAVERLRPSGFGRRHDPSIATDSDPVHERAPRGSCLRDRHALRRGLVGSGAARSGAPAAVRPAARGADLEGRPRGVVEEGLAPLHAGRVRRGGAGARPAPTHRVVTVRARTAGPAAAAGADGPPTRVRRSGSSRASRRAACASARPSTRSSRLSDSMPRRLRSRPSRRSRAASWPPSRTRFHRRRCCRRRAGRSGAGAAPRRCGAATLRREVPVASPTDGAIVEGVVDAAFETEAGWVVVDFKTDAAPGEALDAYLAQESGCMPVPSPPPRAGPPTVCSSACDDASSTRVGGIGCGVAMWTGRATSGPACDCRRPR